MRLISLILPLLAACGVGDFPHPQTPKAVEKCLRCHSNDGPGIEFTASTTPALAGLIRHDVESGRMPPWVPSAESPAFVDDFSLSSDEHAQVIAWAAAGAPFDLPARVKAQRTSPDLVVQLTTPYVPPPPPIGDEYRCFAVAAQGSIGAYRWRLGTPRATHHETALVLTARGLAVAAARQGADGRPGFSCVVLPTEIEAVANLGAAGTAPGSVVELPAGVGAVIPAGGGVLIQMHYTGAAAAGDTSALETWRPEGTVAQLQLHALWAPVEMPCPTGVSSDPRNRCSREWALARSTIQTPDEQRAQADQLLTQCGTTLTAQQQRTPFAASVSDRFLIPTDCVGVLPFDGVIRQVHGHMHTQGASLRAELEVDGAWKPLLVIDKWRWAWESPYTLADPIPFRAGQRLRVSCAHDNGALVQPSAVDGTPGYDGPAQLPLQDASYKVMGYARDNEMCEIFLGVTRT